MEKITKRQFMADMSQGKCVLLRGGSMVESLVNYIFDNIEQIEPITPERVCVKATDYEMIFRDSEGDSHLGMSANGDKVEYLSDGKHYARCHYWTASDGSVMNQLCLYRKM